MKMLVLFIATLASLCSAVPTPQEKLIIDADFFDERFKVYTSQHDIINLALPLNALNFNDEVDDDFSNNDFHLFFTEVDVNADGDRITKGVYVYHNGTATKILENGWDTTAPIGDNNEVYFAATDGIYKYNAEQNKAEKYGSLNDNFISLLQENGTDTTFYAINDKYEMYKITAEGTKKEQIDDVPNAQQFVMDFENNIYFYDSGKQVYVINGEGVTRVQGLKADTKYIQLVKPAFLFDDFVPLVLDDVAYLIYSNGTSEISPFEIRHKPSGYALEGSLIQYYAYEKSIYEYNLMKIIMTGMMDDVQEFFEDKVETIKEVATRTRSSLRKPKH